MKGEEAAEGASQDELEPKRSGGRPDPFEGLVWADDRWVPIDGEQFEIRSNAPALLDSLAPRAEAGPSGAVQHEGALSLVVGMTGQRTRRLPTLYLGSAPLFADRDQSVVLERMRMTVETVIESERRPAYVVQPCELGDRRGLYARDTFSRSPYRRRLARAGMLFTDDPYVKSSEDGSFVCDDWGRFSPTFMVLGYDHEDPAELEVTTGAILPITMIERRIGGITTSHLQSLISGLAGVAGYSAGDARVVATALQPGSVPG